MRRESAYRRPWIALTGHIYRAIEMLSNQFPEHHTARRRRCCGRSLLSQELGFVSVHMVNDVVLFGKRRPIPSGSRRTALRAYCSAIPRSMVKRLQHLDSIVEHSGAIAVEPVGALERSLSFLSILRWSES